MYAARDISWKNLFFEFNRYFKFVFTKLTDPKLRLYCSMIVGTPQSTTPHNGTALRNTIPIGPGTRESRNRRQNTPATQQEKPWQNLAQWKTLTPKRPTNSRGVFKSHQKWTQLNSKLQLCIIYLSSLEWKEKVCTNTYENCT